MTADHRALKHLSERVFATEIAIRVIEERSANLFESPPIIATRAAIVVGKVYPSGEAPRQSCRG